MKQSHIILSTAAVALTAVVTLGAFARQDPPDTKRPARATPVAERGEKPQQDDRAVIQAQRWSYPLATCPITGEKLEAKPTEFVVEGRLVRTCCGGCKGKVVKDPALAIKKIDAAVVAEQKAAYPLATCAVTDAKLDDKAVDYVYGTRLVRLANDDAVKAFTKDPKAAMAKVDAAYVKAQTASYPLQTCVVTGEKLGGMGAPHDQMYGTTLVRFCCAGCTADFEKDPAPFLKKIADARKPAK